MSYVYTEEGDEEKYNELLDKRYNFLKKKPTRMIWKHICPLRGNIEKDQHYIQNCL